MKVFAVVSALVLAVIAAATPASPSRPASALRREPITPIPERSISDAKAQLGEALFRDRRLSGNGRVACVSCHDLNTNGAGASRAPAPTSGDSRLRNTPTVFNAALNFRLNWDGAVRNLVEQADTTMRNPAIMGTTPEAAAARLRADRAWSRRSSAPTAGLRTGGVWSRP